MRGVICFFCSCAFLRLASRCLLVSVYVCVCFNCVFVCAGVYLCSFMRVSVFGFISFFLSKTSQQLDGTHPHIHGFMWTCLYIHRVLVGVGACF